MNAKSRTPTRILVAVAAAAAALSPGTVAQAAITPAAGIPIRVAHSGKCLNVPNASTANSIAIIQYTCAAAAVTNDKWVLVPQGNGTYWIQGVGSGKCLNIPNNNTADNTPIIQYTCVAATNELWKIDETANKPTIRFVSALDGKCLNITGASTADSAALVQYTCTTGQTASNEQFYLPPTASPTATSQPFTSKQPVSVLQGAAAATGGVAPVSYSYIRADHQLQIITDRNPDPANTDPNAPDPVVAASDTYGYTGRTQAARLADGRIQVTAHDATAGDTVLLDEATTGTGQYGPIRDLGGAFTSQPTLGPLAEDGRLASYAIVGAALWYAPQTLNNPQTPYGAWRSLGGTGLTGTPVVVHSTTGARVFALNTAGHLLTAELAAGTLSDWADLGGTGLTGTPAVVTSPTYLTTIFARTADGTIVTKKQTATGAYTDWTPIPGIQTAGSPSAIWDTQPGRIAVTARGTDNLIYLTYETAQDTGTFGAWTAISDPDLYPESIAASDPTAFTYTVPSGTSFDIAFQSSTDLDVPIIFTFDPTTTATTAKAATHSSTPHGHLHRLTPTEHSSTPNR